MAEVGRTDETEDIINNNSSQDEIGTPVLSVETTDIDEEPVLTVAVVEIDSNNAGITKG